MTKTRVGIWEKGSGFFCAGVFVSVVISPARSERDAISLKGILRYGTLRGFYRHLKFLFFQGGGAVAPVFPKSVTGNTPQGIQLSGIIDAIVMATVALLQDFPTARCSYCLSISSSIVIC